MLWLPFTRAMNMPNEAMSKEEHRMTVAEIRASLEERKLDPRYAFGIMYERAEQLEAQNANLKHENAILRQVAKQAVDVVEPILRGL